MLRSHCRLAAILVIGTLLCIALAAFAINLPYVQERIGWRISVVRAQIKYAISPPDEAVFTPNPTIAAIVQATLSAYTPTTPQTQLATPTPETSAVPLNSPTPTLSPTPIPLRAQLTGVVHEYQKWNNCGPANLSMALSFWGWPGDQRDTGAYLKPNLRDKNVMPYEMASFVEEQTNLDVVVRVGGDLDLLKRFIAAGFPVVVEKGFEGAGFDGWMGHYEVLTGYDDARARFTAQDSYIMANLPVSYAEMESYWRHFNYTYLVIYPPEREQEVYALLGEQLDELTNLHTAAQKASDEIFTLNGREQYFAWFNRGTSLMRLQDYTGAAGAYDAAFQLYADMDPEKVQRPWRMMWYNTGPYWAYFYTGRYYDVINLASQTLVNSSEPVLEESFYWRALAREAVGDIAGAIEDLHSAVDAHPDWEPAVAYLERLGVSR